MFVSVNMYLCLFGIYYLDSIMMKWIYASEQLIAHLYCFLIPLVKIGIVKVMHAVRSITYSS